MPSSSLSYYYKKGKRQEATRKTYDIEERITKQVDAAVFEFSPLPPSLRASPAISLQNVSFKSPEIRIRSPMMKESSIESPESILARQLNQVSAVRDYNRIVIDLSENDRSNMFHQHLVSDHSSIVAAMEAVVMSRAMSLQGFALSPLPTRYEDSMQYHTQQRLLQKKWDICRRAFSRWRSDFDNKRLQAMQTRSMLRLRVFNLLSRVMNGWKSLLRVSTRVAEFTTRLQRRRSLRRRMNAIDWLHTWTLSRHFTLSQITKADLHWRLTLLLLGFQTWVAQYRHSRHDRQNLVIAQNHYHLYYLRRYYVKWDSWIVERLAYIQRFQTGLHFASLNYFRRTLDRWRINIDLKKQICAHARKSKRRQCRRLWILWYDYSYRQHELNQKISCAVQFYNTRISRYNLHRALRAWVVDLSQYRIVALHAVKYINERLSRKLTHALYRWRQHRFEVVNRHCRLQGGIRFAHREKLKRGLHRWMLLYNIENTIEHKTHKAMTISKRQRLLSITRRWFRYACNTAVEASANSRVNNVMNRVSFQFWRKYSILIRKISVSTNLRRMELLHHIMTTWIVFRHAIGRCNAIAQKHWNSKGPVLFFRKWRAHLQQDMKKKLRTSIALNFYCKRGVTLSMCKQAWKEWCLFSREAGRRRRVSLRICKRWKSHRLYLAFDRWCSFVSYTLTSKRCLVHWWHQTLSRSFHTWRSYCFEKQEIRDIQSRVILRLKMLEMFKCLSKWREYASIRSLECEIIMDVSRQLRQYPLARAWRSWITWSTDKSYMIQLWQRACRWWLVRAKARIFRQWRMFWIYGVEFNHVEKAATFFMFSQQAKALRRWMDWYHEYNETKAIVADSVAHMLGRGVWRALLTWQQYAIDRHDTIDVLTAAINRWNHVLIFKTFDKWCDLIKNVRLAKCHVRWNNYLGVKALSKWREYTNNRLLEHERLIHASELCQVALIEKHWRQWRNYYFSFLDYVDKLKYAVRRWRERSLTNALLIWLEFHFLLKDAKQFQRRVVARWSALNVANAINKWRDYALKRAEQIVELTLIMKDWNDGLLGRSWRTWRYYANLRIWYLDTILPFASRLRNNRVNMSFVHWKQYRNQKQYIREILLAALQWSRRWNIRQGLVSWKNYIIFECRLPRELESKGAAFHYSTVVFQTLTQLRKNCFQGKINDGMNIKADITSRTHRLQRNWVFWSYYAIERHRLEILVVEGHKMLLQRHGTPMFQCWRLYSNKRRHEDFLLTTAVNHFNLKNIFSAVSKWRYENKILNSENIIAPRHWDHYHCRSIFNFWRTVADEDREDENDTFGNSVQHWMIHTFSRVVTSWRKLTRLQLEETKMSITAFSLHLSKRLRHWVGYCRRKIDGDEKLEMADSWYLEKLLEKIRKPLNRWRRLSIRKAKLCSIGVAVSSLTVMNAWSRAVDRWIMLVENCRQERKSMSIARMFWDFKIVASGIEKWRKFSREACELCERIIVKKMNMGMMRWRRYYISRSIDFRCIDKGICHFNNKITREAFANLLSYVVYKNEVNLRRCREIEAILSEYWKQWREKYIDECEFRRLEEIAASTKTLQCIYLWKDYARMHAVSSHAYNRGVEFHTLKYLLFSWSVWVLHYRKCLADLEIVRRRRRHYVVLWRTWAEEKRACELVVQKIVRQRAKKSVSTVLCQWNDFCYRKCENLTKYQIACMYFVTHNCRLVIATMRKGGIVYSKLKNLHLKRSYKSKNNSLNALLIRKNDYIKDLECFIIMKKTRLFNILCHVRRYAQQAKKWRTMYDIAIQKSKIVLKNAFLQHWRYKYVPNHIHVKELMTIGQDFYLLSSQRLHFRHWLKLRRVTLFWRRLVCRGAIQWWRTATGTALSHWRRVAPIMDRLNSTNRRVVFHHHRWLLKSGFGKWAKLKSWFYYEGSEEGKWCQRMIRWAFATWELRSFESRTRNIVYVKPIEDNYLSHLPLSIELSLASAAASAWSENPPANFISGRLSLPISYSLAMTELLSFYFYVWYENTINGSLAYEKRQIERCRLAQSIALEQRRRLRLRLQSDIGRANVSAAFGSSTERFSSKPDRSLVRPPVTYDKLRKQRIVN